MKIIAVFLILLSFQVFGAVPIPDNFKVSYNSSDKSVNLSWNKVVDSKTAGYEIFKTDSRTVYHVSRYPITQTKNNYYTDTAIEPGKSYLYAICAYTFSGEKSPLTRALSIEIPLYGSEIPAKITTLEVKEIADGAQLSWTSINDPQFDHYNIYKSESPLYTVENTPIFNASVTNQNLCTFSVAGLEKGRKYYFAVTVVRKNGIENKSVQAVEFVYGSEQEYIYACDKDNKRVVKITRDGKDVAQITSDLEPVDCEIDSNGNLYVMYYKTISDNGDPVFTENRNISPVILTNHKRGWEYVLYKYPYGISEGAQILSVPDFIGDCFIIDNENNIWIPNASGTLNKYSSTGQLLLSVSQANNEAFSANGGQFTGALCADGNSVWVCVKRPDPADPEKWISKFINIALDGTFKQEFRVYYFGPPPVLATVYNNYLALCDGKVVALLNRNGTFIKWHINAGEQIKGLWASDDKILWYSFNRTSGDSVYSVVNGTDYKGNIPYYSNSAFGTKYKNLYGITGFKGRILPQKYLQAVPGNTFVDLLWQKSDNEAFGGYKLYMAETAFSSVEGMSPITSMADINATKFRSTGLTPGKTYYFALTVVLKDGSENKTVNCVAATTVQNIETQEQEINNDFPLANYCDMTSTNVLIHGAITPKGDYDYYKVTLPTSGILEIRLSNIQSDIDPRVRVYNSAFSLITETNNSNAADIFLNAKIASTGDYFICLNDYYGSNFSDQLYSLAFTFYPADQYEFNNTFDKAAAITLDKNAMASLNLTIIPNGDKDYFKIKVPKAGIIRNELYNIPSNIDPRIQIYNAQEYLINDINNSNAADINFYTKAPQPGYYYICISDYYGNNWSNSPINLRISYFISDEMEPNNYWDTATLLSLNEENIIKFEATILPNGDYDYFKIKINSSGTLVVNATSFASNLDPRLEIFDASLLPLTDTSNSTGSDINLSAVIKNNGYVYLKFSDYYNNNWSTQPYKVTVTFYPTDDSSHDDNGFGQATALAFDDQNITSAANSINPKGDYDYYKIYLPLSGAFKVELTDLDSSIDPYVIIYDEQYKSLQEKNNSSAADILMYQSAYKAGWYYIRISDYYGSNWSSKNYKLKVSFFPSDSHEPNNTWSEAALIVLNSSNYFSTHATISNVGDYDYYIIDLKNPGLLRVELTDLESSIDPYIRIYNSHYNLLNSTNNSSAANIDLYTTLPAPGQYYVSINDYYNTNWSDHPYSLKISFFPADSSEPNNTYSQATVITLTDNTAVISATINGAGDNDYYKVLLPKDGTLQTKLSNLSKDFDPHLLIYDSQYALINESSNSSANTIDMYSKIVVKGYFYIRVRDYDENFSSPDTYKLEIRLYPSDKYENNNVFDEATTLALLNNECTIKATINELIDYDYYRIMVPQNGILHISWTNINSNLDPWIRVFDEQQKQITESSNSTGSNILLNVSCPEGGYYYVALSDRDDNNWSDEEYILKLSVHLSDAYEPNNSFSEATSVVIEANTSQERMISINPVGDYDYFVVNLPHKGELITQTVGMSVNLDPRISVYDFSFIEIANSYNSSGTDINKSVAIKNSGTYYIRIHDVDDNNWDDSLFTLKLTYSAGDKYELNDSFYAAAPISVSEPVKANILPAGDIDCFRFQAQYSGICTIKASGFYSSLDPSLTVYDSIKNSIGSNYNNSAQDIILNVNVNQGEEYVIYLYDIDHNNYDPQNYTIEITNQDPGGRIHDMTAVIQNAYNTMKSNLKYNDQTYLEAGKTFNTLCSDFESLLITDITEGDCKLIEAYVENLSEENIPAFRDINIFLNEYLSQKDRSLSPQLEKLAAEIRAMTTVEVAR